VYTVISYHHQKESLRKFSHHLILLFFILHHHHNKSSIFSKVYYHKSFLDLKVSGTSVVSTKQVGESATITTHQKLEMMAIKCLTMAQRLCQAFGQQG
jgi:hypothetical protein